MDSSFQWLANQIRPFTTGHLIEELVPGHAARRARQLEHIDKRDKQWHERKAHELKKARLERELANAEWILNYEKRLAHLHLQRIAEEDVEQIVFYIAEDNPNAADAFRAAIEKARATLEDLPEIGSPCDFDSQDVADLRMLLVPHFKKYIIFYRFTRDAVEIVRVLHGARDIQSLFGE